MHFSKEKNMFNIIAVVKSATTINGLVSEEAFKAALETFALEELNAAKEALSKVEYSSSPRESLNRVLTHLESAHIALHKSWNSPFINVARHYKAEWHALLDARVCCLIAVCHFALQDSEKLISDALIAAEEAIQYEKKKGIVDLLQYINPAALVDLFTNDEINNRHQLVIDESDFAEFKKELLGHNK
jgi:predicted transcriptional regulator